jgi:ATP-dependent DNA ligase
MKENHASSRWGEVSRRRDYSFDGVVSIERSDGKGVRRRAIESKGLIGSSGTPPHSVGFRKVETSWRPIVPKRAKDTLLDGVAQSEPGREAFPLPITTPPMEAKLHDELPDDGAWQFEPKWDGVRCLAFRSGDEVDLRAKSGKPLGRYFPEVVAGLRTLKADGFVIDGELAIPTAEGLSFGALQMRLHPAESRIRKLSVETPAIFILFDILAAEGELPGDRPLRERRARVEAFIQQAGKSELLQLSPYTHSRKEAQGWLDTSGGAIDGVVAKPLDEPYRFGERAMIKVKCLRTADCVVGGFRYGTGSDEVASLLLGLYNDQGKLDHVGFTSTIARADRPALTKRLEAMIEPPGFTGNAPGGPSRWSTERSGEWQPLRPDLVAEVRYDHVSDDRFRHGTKLLRWRLDKAPRQCTVEQIAPRDAGASQAFMLRPDASRRGE